VSEEPQLNEEIEQTLKNYLAIQQEERDLRERKTALQQKLKDHLAGHQFLVWKTHAGEAPVKVRYSRKTHVEYDEELLRQRLGVRYRQILSPDPRKLKQLSDQQRELLEPVIDTIGTPDADRVKAAIQQGVMKPEEFKGAFTKQDRVSVAVSQVRGRPGPADEPEPADEQSY
jgi:hypothetical protein